MRREWLAAVVIESEGLMEKEFRKATRAQPWEGAVIIDSSKGESPIAIDSVPAEHRRFSWHARHRLNGIPDDFANMPDVNHGQCAHSNATTGVICHYYSWRMPEAVTNIASTTTNLR